MFPSESTTVLRASGTTADARAPQATMSATHSRYLTDTFTPESWMPRTNRDGAMSTATTEARSGLIAAVSAPARQPA